MADVEIATGDWINNFKWPVLKLGAFIIFRKLNS